MAIPWEEGRPGSAVWHLASTSPQERVSMHQRQRHGVLLAPGVPAVQHSTLHTSLGRDSGVWTLLGGVGW